RRSTSDSPPARAVSTRASVQILSGVLLRAESGRVHLAATDMPPALRHRPPRRARRRRPLARAQPARADAGAGRRLTSRGRRPEPRHPRWWRTARSAGTVPGAVAELVASRLNANVGGWLLSPCIKVS